MNLNSSINKNLLSCKTQIQFLKAQSKRESFETFLKNTNVPSFLSSLPATRNKFNSIEEFQNDLRQPPRAFTFDDFQELTKHVATIDKDFAKDSFLKLSILFNNAFNELRKFTNALHDLRRDVDSLKTLANQLSTINKTLLKTLKTKH